MFILGHYATTFPLQIDPDTEATLRIQKLFSASQERCIQFAYQMNYEGQNDVSSNTLKVQDLAYHYSSIFL